MRLVVLIVSGVLSLGSLSACSDSEADNVNGDAPPSTGPTAVQETPAPTKAGKHKRKARPSATPAPTLVPEPTLPPGEEFDPEHYDPEGDRDPNATPEASGSPAG